MQNVRILCGNNCNLQNVSSTIIKMLSFKSNISFLSYFDVLFLRNRFSDTKTGLIKFYLRRLSFTNKLKIQCQNFVCSS